MFLISLLMSLSLHLLYSAASLERNEFSSFATTGFRYTLSLPKVDCHFPEFTKSFINEGTSLLLKWTYLFARAARLSMALALMICWVLTSHSLYGRSESSGTCTLLDEDDTSVLEAAGLFSPLLISLGSKPKVSVEGVKFSS